MIYQLVFVEWSDYGDDISVQMSCYAVSPLVAANVFRSRGLYCGYVRKAGEYVLHEMSLLC